MKCVVNKVKQIENQDTELNLDNELNKVWIKPSHYTSSPG